MIVTSPTLQQMAVTLIDGINVVRKEHMVNASIF